LNELKWEDDTIVSVSDKTQEVNPVKIDTSSFNLNQVTIAS